MTTLKAVVLPAPLGPIRLTISAFADAESSCPRARRAPEVHGDL